MRLLIDKLRLLWKFQALIALLLIPHFLVAQNPETIIKRYLDSASSGNFKSWEKIQTAYIESTGLFYDPENSTGLNASKVSVLKQYRIWPDKSMTEVFEDSILMSRFYHVKGKHFFVMGNNQNPVSISTEPFEPYFEFEPVIVYRLLNNATSIDLVGQKRFDTLKCYQIKITTKALTWNLFINKKSFRLEYWSNSTDGNIYTMTKLSSYKKFGLYLIPMAEEKAKNGKVFYRSKRTLVELNTYIDQKKFDFNESGGNKK